MRPNLSVDGPASSASSGGWGGTSSGFVSKARSYKGTTSDEESGSDDRGVVMMEKHLHGHGDEKKEDVAHISTSDPTTSGVLSSLGPASSSSNDRALAANAFQNPHTEDSQHLKPPVVGHDHDNSSDEDGSHNIPGAFIWTPTKPRFKKLHPH